MMEFKADVVYPCSPTQGLTRLTPRVSTHGEKWVYATDDLVMSAVFLGRRGGDFTCATGTLDGQPYLVGRFRGAIDLRYKGVQCSLYVLPAEGFLAGKTSWSKDLVCRQEVTPLREIRIADPKKYLLNLASDGKITVKFHPDRFAGILEDDEDLVQRAVTKYQSGRDSALNGIKEFHPSLLPRVMQALQKHKDRPDLV